MRRYRKIQRTQAQQWANLGKLSLIAIHLLWAILWWPAWVIFVYVWWQWLPESNYRRTA